MNLSKAWAVKECDTPAHGPTEQLRKLTLEIRHTMANASMFVVWCRKEYRQQNIEQKEDEKSNKKNK